MEFHEIKALAAEFHFVERTRESTGDKFWKLADGSPEWQTDVIREAHDGMLPDDHKYAMVKDALDLILESGTAEEYDDRVSEWEPSLYVSDLYGWLGSNENRAGYVDEVVMEYGHGGSFIEEIGRGWWFEFQGVARIVLRELDQVMLRGLMKP